MGIDNSERRERDLLKRSVPVFFCFCCIWGFLIFCFGGVFVWIFVSAFGGFSWGFFVCFGFWLVLFICFDGLFVFSQNLVLCYFTSQVTSVFGY